MRYISTCMKYCRWYYASTVTLIFYMMCDVTFRLSSLSSHMPPSFVCQVLQYNVPFGKKNRGLAVVESFRFLCTTPPTDDDIRTARVLGWCVEMVCIAVLPCPFHVRKCVQNSLMFDITSHSITYVCVNVINFFCIAPSRFSRCR